MPVRKFRSVEDMEGNTWREPGDPRLFRAIRSAWDFARRTVPMRFPPGVHRHRSIEDAELWRLRIEAENFAAHQRRLQRLGQKQPS